MTHPIIERILAPDAPLTLRLAAARASLPVGIGELMPALVRLSYDPDDSVREAAQATVAGFAAEELDPVLADPATEGPVLEHLLDFAPMTADQLRLTLANPAVTDATLCRLAESDRIEALEHIARNQERLMACPALLERLETNPHTGPELAGLLADFREQFFPDGIPVTPVEPEGPRTDVFEPTDVVTEEELQSLLGEVGDLPFLSVEFGNLIESQGMEADLQDMIHDDATLESVWKRLSRLSGPARLREAMRGGKESRAILVRDHNRIIACAVMKNPRITENEVEGLAASRALHEDVLRVIGQSREWMRCYNVLVRLVRNPKTPGGVAMNHVGRLMTKDLQTVARDHNVPELIRKTARRTVDQRERKTTPGVKRH